MEDAPVGKRASASKNWTPPETEGERYLRKLGEEKKESAAHAAVDVAAQVEAFLASPDRFAVLRSTKTQYRDDFVAAVVTTVNGAAAIVDLSFFTTGSGCYDQKALVRKA